MKSSMALSNSLDTAEAAPQTTIEQGVIKINARVNASYFVK